MHDRCKKNLKATVHLCVQSSIQSLLLLAALLYITWQYKRKTRRANYRVIKGFPRALNDLCKKNVIQLSPLNNTGFSRVFSSLRWSKIIQNNVCFNQSSILQGYIQHCNQKIFPCYRKNRKNFRIDLL